MSSNLSPALKAMVAFLDVLVLKFVMDASLTKFSPEFRTIFNSFIVNPKSLVNVSWIDPRLIVALLKKSVLFPTSILVGVGELPPGIGIPTGIVEGFIPVSSWKFASPKLPVPEEKSPILISPTSALNSVLSVSISGIASFKSPNSNSSFLFIEINPMSTPDCTTVKRESKSSEVVSISTLLMFASPITWMV